MSWQQLVGIIEEGYDLDAQERNKVPEVCPNDFTTLVEAPNGVLVCSWDGWQYPRDA